MVYCALEALKQLNKTRGEIMRYPWFFVLIFLGLMVIFILLLYGLGLLIKWQANKPKKRFFAPIPRPGSFSFVVLEGRVVEIIENVVGWKLLEESDLTENEGGLNCFTIGKKEELDLLEEYLGVKWIGPFATIEHFPKWSWSEFKQVEEKEKGKGVLKYEVELRGPEDITDFFFQFPYPVITDDAEIEGNIRVKITAVLTVLHLHPIRAFHLNKDPVALFNAMVQSAFRSYVVNMKFNDVKAIKASPNGEDNVDVDGKKIQSFWGILKKLNGIELDPEKGNPIYNKVDPLGLFGKLGYYVARAEVVQVETVGATADALEAARIADLKGDAEIAAAKKAAEALVVSAEGRMKAADLDAIAQRTLNEQNAGYYASLPGGARMYAANQVASKGSSVSMWVEGGNDIKVTIPLSPAPDKPKRPGKDN